MKSTKHQRFKVQRNLLKIPTEKLEEVNDFIEFLLIREKSKNRNVKSLEGIWEHLDFEKNSNLEKSIREIRKESSKSLNKKLNQWNI
jgi:hypothetical protein